MLTRSLKAITAVLALVSMSHVDAARAAGELEIVAPKSGAAVASPLTVVIRFAAAESSESGHVHAHLIIDSPLPAAGAVIPMDSRHLHLMQGETKMTLDLPPGRHTLQLIVTGHDHRVPPHAAQSSAVTVDIR